MRRRDATYPQQKVELLLGRDLNVGERVGQAVDAAGIAAGGVRYEGGAASIDRVGGSGGHVAVLVVS